MVEDISGKIVRVSLDKLKQYKRNVKKHPAKQIKALAKAIQRVGFRSPIEVDEVGEIIAGHGRLLAAEYLGMTDVPVIYQLGLTDQQKREHRLADNRLAELAATDESLLADELLALVSQGSDLEAIGYGEEKIVEVGEQVKVETSQLQPEFWISVRGPLVVQPDTISRLADSLREIDGLEVSFGVIS